MARKSNFKTEVIRHIKKGLQHMNPNYSLEVYRQCKDIRKTAKNIKGMSWYEVDQLLRALRKVISKKWKGQAKWHINHSFFGPHIKKDWLNPTESKDESLFVHQCFLGSTATAGVKKAIIDYDNDYAKLAKMLGGEHIGDGEDIHINPFEIINTDVKDKK